MTGACDAAATDACAFAMGPEKRIAPGDLPR